MEVVHVSESETRVSKMFEAVFRARIGVSANAPSQRLDRLVAKDRWVVASPRRPLARAETVGGICNCERIM